MGAKTQMTIYFSNEFNMTVSLLVMLILIVGSVVISIISGKENGFNKWMGILISLFLSFGAGMIGLTTFFYKCSTMV